MRYTRQAFTIVELLIVIVVIAILASISLVAYNGIQARARDNIRYSNVKEIAQLLELYRINHGHYPDYASGITSDDANGCVNTDGWSYSWSASTGTWLSPLVDEGITTTVPVPPLNTCDHYIRYTFYNYDPSECPSRPYDGYVIQVMGAENTFIPKDTVTNGEVGAWKLCPTAPIEWWVDEETWVFVKEDI